MQGKLEVFARLQPYRKSVEFMLQQETRGRFFRAKPLQLEEVDEFELPESAFTLEPAAVQQLMDELWQCGYRPSEGTGSAGQLASVKYHLEDMRKLVFEKERP